MQFPSIKLSFKVCLLLAGCLSSLAHAAIIPFGIQSDITLSTVENDWGWSECHRSAANSPEGVVEENAVTSACNQNYMMMAVWDIQNSIFSIAAAGETSVVSKVTFENQNSDSNYDVLDNWSFGTNFYRTASIGSWGFTSIGSVALNTADVNLVNGLNNFSSRGTKVSEQDTGELARGLSFHTIRGSFRSGWRFNATGNDAISISTPNFQRVFFQANVNSQSVNVPAPAGILMLTLAVLGMTLRKKVLQRSH